jgi:thymidylate synthase ThyX
LDYTKDEELVLNHFFTNLNKPVFFVKNMHPEVWALMQARYSRATEGMRESFLKLIKEDPENFKSLVNALQHSDVQLKMDKAVDKAIKFMDKWVLGYGHASIAEGATIGLGLEGISILATKIIEDNRLCSFIEKSTRYVMFDRNSFYIDPVLKKSEHGKEVEGVVHNLFEVYTKIQPKVLEHVKKVAPRKEGEAESAWERACGARTFDSIRYLLPACTKTSLGWTLNARNLAHGIKKMISTPIVEMQTLGKEIREEGKKLLPSLLKYADESKYISETDNEMYKVAKEIVKPNYVSKPNHVTLVHATADLDNVLIASILYKYSNAPYETIMEKAKKMSMKEKEKVLDTYLSKMGDFDWPMRELEHTHFIWDITIDYGAFRDLQRHRICTQTNQLLTAFEGYETPPDIINAGVRAEYDAAMKKAGELYKKLYEKYPLEAQYIIPLGYRKRYIMTDNLRHMFHLVKIRTTSQGHYSYRNTARQMYEILNEKYPLVTKYMTCHLKDEELGRLKAELKLQEKIDKGII